MTTQIAGRTRQLLASILTSLLCLATPHARGQEPLPFGERTFGERIDVEVVDLEVVVLDPKGAPVTNLGKGDFSVLINGEPAEIVDFAPHFSVVESVQQEGAPPTPAATNEGAGKAEPPRVWLVFADMLRSGEFRRTAAMRALQEFLNSNVRKGDRVMIGYYDGVALRLLQPLTDNRNVAARALQTLTGREAPSRVDVLGAQLDEEDRFRIEEAAILSLRDFVALASGIPGRRLLLLVGGGYTLNGWENFDRAARLQSDYEELRDSLASSDITVYGIYSWQDAGSGFGADSPGDLQPGDTDAAPDLSQTALGSTISTLANDTGGAPLVATADLERRLEQTDQRMEGYYDLAIRTPAGSAGKRLDVQVHVGREGLRVQHRRLLHTTTDAEANRGTSLAGLLSDHPENPWNLKASVGRLYRDKLRRLRAPIEIQIPIESLLLVGHNDRHIGRLQFFLSVRDANGNYTSIDPKDLAFDLSDQQLAALRKGGIRYKLELVVSSGATEVSLTVADTIARSHSTTRFKIGSGPTRPDGPQRSIRRGW